MTTALPGKYSLRLREHTVRACREAAPEPSCEHLAGQLGAHPAAVRTRIRRDEADCGEREDRLTLGERAEPVTPRKENVQLERPNDVPRTNPVLFATQLDPTRPG